MKRIFIAALICIVGAMFAKAQGEPDFSGFETEEKVTSELTKSSLWINLKKWVSSSFSSYKHVVDMEDKDAGVLIIKLKSGLEYPASHNWSAQYEATYQIDERENKYRIKVYNNSVHVEPHLGDVEMMSTSSLKVAKNELEKVIDISKALQGSQTWLLDAYYLQVMKTNPRFTIVMNAVKEGYESFNSLVLNSLKNAMAYKDDF